MTQPEYTEVQCWLCHGQGTRHDATNMDKVATGGRGETRCSECRGQGTKLWLTSSIELEQRQSAELATQPAEPIGEIPDWMLE